MASLGWLVSFLVFLGVEMAFCCLTSLWFAVGRWGTFAVALTGAPWNSSWPVCGSIIPYADSYTGQWHF